MAALAARAARRADATADRGPREWFFCDLARSRGRDRAETSWTGNPIDAFVLDLLQRKGLRLNAPADKQTLLRRVTFDLVGLPPTPAEQAAFLGDMTSNAYRAVVDRLLASPRYGERWSQHWLDLVRYAETAGYKKDDIRPNAYKYRDYVINAFNDDLPYDEFLAQQLAGDELEPDNPAALVATGLNRLYPEETNASNFVQARQTILDDMTEVTGLAFMGLTIGCARCHDHKFDPILQTDFYRLQAFFSPILPNDDVAAAPRSSSSSMKLGSTDGRPPRPIFAKSSTNCSTPNERRRSRRQSRPAIRPRSLRWRLRRKNERRSKCNWPSLPM